MLFGERLVEVPVPVDIDHGSMECLYPALLLSPVALTKLHAADFGPYYEQPARYSRQRPELWFAAPLRPVAADSWSPTALLAHVRKFDLPSLRVPAVPTELSTTFLFRKAPAVTLFRYYPFATYSTRADVQQRKMDKSVIMAHRLAMRDHPGNVTVDGRDLASLVYDEDGNRPIPSLTVTLVHEVCTGTVADTFLSRAQIEADVRADFAWTECAINPDTARAYAEAEAYLANQLYPSIGVERVNVALRILPHGTERHLLAIREAFVAVHETIFQAQMATREGDSFAQSNGRFFAMHEARRAARQVVAVAWDDALASGDPFAVVRACDRVVVDTEADPNARNTAIAAANECVTAAKDRLMRRIRAFRDHVVTTASLVGPRAVPAA
ncbi:MAG: hypothetical protein LBF24_00510 [Puniceicoccales bacterium]|jgi:hypothetical protein|nr:hypothetical protein [Puniceicoccales bacterium]